MPEQFAFHEECTGFIGAKPEDVFAMLDDHARLAKHMARPSWRMGWATMQIAVDPGKPRGLGSHIAIRGRVLGFRLFVDEEVTQYDPPSMKAWETTVEPRLLVIGQYRMALSTTPQNHGTLLRVAIDYDWPKPALSRIAGAIFGRMYARWCVRQMVEDASAGT